MWCKQKLFYSNGRKYWVVCLLVTACFGLCADTLHMIHPNDLFREPMDAFSRAIKEWRELSEFGNQPIISNEVVQQACSWRDGSMPKMSRKIKSNIWKGSRIIRPDKRCANDDQTRFSRHDRYVNEMNGIRELARRAYEQCLVLNIDICALNMIAKSYSSLACNKSLWRDLASRTIQISEKAEKKISNDINDIREKLLREYGRITCKKKEYKDIYVRNHPQEARDVMMMARIRQIEKETNEAAYRARYAEECAREAKQAAQNALNMMDEDELNHNREMGRNFILNTIQERKHFMRQTKRK